MERRSFLGLSFTGLLAAPAAAGAEGRLFGVPDSVSGPTPSLNDSLVLSIERMNLDVGSRASALLASTATVWTDLFTDEKARADFDRNPHKYLEDRGVSPDVAGRSDSDIALLRVACSPKGRAIAESGDVRAYLVYLKESGLNVDFKSGVGEALRSMILEHEKEFRALVGAEIAKLPPEQQRALSGGSELASLSTLLAGRSIVGSYDAQTDEEACTPIVCIAGLLVAIAALAVAALAISIVVTISLGLTFFVATVAVLATEIVVTAWGDGDLPLSVPAEKSHALSNAAYRLHAYGDAYDSFKRTTRAAQIAGAPNASLELIKDFVAEEIRTVVTVCEELNLIALDPRTKDAVIEDAIKRSYMTIGLAT